MTAPLSRLLGSLSGRIRSARITGSASASAPVLAVLAALGRSGSLVGFRRRPRRRVELLVRPGLPPPRPYPPRPRSSRQLAALSPTALVGSSLGVRSAAALVRSRRGGLPLLLPFGR